MPAGRVSSITIAVLNPDQSCVTKREQRLVQSGRRNHINRRDGTTFIPTDNGFMPIASNSTSPEELLTQLVDQRKREYLIESIDACREFQQVTKDFSNKILTCESLVAYNLELYGTHDLQKLMEHAKTIVHQLPECEDKNFWRRNYKTHLEEHLALLKAKEAQQSPEELEEMHQRQLVASTLATQEEQRALEGRRLEQQRIRELRKLTPETSGDRGEDDQPVAVAAAARPVEPMEVLSFDKFDPSSLEILGEAVKTKFDAAIAAIKNYEKPVGFRGNIKVEDVNILHCGLGGGLRLYYTIKNEELYVLDVSNHDTDALLPIVKKFIEEFGAK